VCRAVTVLCVAPDAERLQELKRAAVGAEWELAPGATDTREALDQIDALRPHAVVVFGPFEDLVALVAERFPAMTIVADHQMPGVTDVVAAAPDVRAALRMQRRPGGPVG
jgi:collagenase-like PrtC family protease